MSHPLTQPCFVFIYQKLIVLLYIVKFLVICLLCACGTCNSGTPWNKAYNCIASSWFVLIHFPLLWYMPLLCNFMVAVLVFCLKSLTKPPLLLTCLVYVHASLVHPCIPQLFTHYLPKPSLSVLCKWLLCLWFNVCVPLPATAFVFFSLLNHKFICCFCLVHVCAWYKPLFLYYIVYLMNIQSTVILCNTMW